MSIETTFVHSLTFYHLGGTASLKTYGEAAGTIPCFIQPLDDQNEVIDGLAYGRTFRAFAPIRSGIKGSDKAVDQAGNEYRVTGVKDFDFGDNAHSVLLITKEA